MPISNEDLNAIVEVVQSRLDSLKTEIMGEVHQALETQRQDFYGVVQQLGENQTNLYEMIVTRMDPGAMTALAHDAWRRWVLNEAEYVRRAVESEVGDGPMFSEEEVPDIEPEPEPEPTEGAVKQKPKVVG